MEFSREVNHEASDLLDAFANDKAERIHENLNALVITMVNENAYDSEVFQKAIELYADDINDVVVITLVVHRLIKNATMNSIEGMLRKIGKMVREANPVIDQELRYKHHAKIADDLKKMPSVLLKTFKDTHKCDDCEAKNDCSIYTEMNKRKI